MGRVELTSSEWMNMLNYAYFFFAVYSLPKFYYSKWYIMSKNSFDVYARYVDFNWVGLILVVFIGYSSEGVLYRILFLEFNIFVKFKLLGLSYKFPRTLEIVWTYSFTEKGD